MSMLSAQCDELRAMAESVGLAMPQAATLMMEAADTIWELRNKCADLMNEREEYVWTREFMDRMAKHCGTKDCPSLVAYVEGLESENAKLRKELESIGTAAYLYGRSDLKSENAKLRELLGGVGHLLFILDVDYCVACPRDSISHPCPVYTIKGGECLYKSDMRELGVEVE